jgi:hypothetical protein
MTEQEYLTGRVDDQIAWYDRKSAANQKAFKILRIIEIAAAVVIPLLAGQVGAGRGVLPWVIGGLGATVAIAAGLLSLYRLQENWIQYRATCEGLRHEKFLYLTRVEPYAVDEAFRLFVQRVESLVSKEHSNWAQYMREATGPSEGGGAPGA